MIPSEFLDKLRDHTTLSALLIRTGTPLKRYGREWKTCCPFHQEKSPSFTVNDDKGFYHCFGCGAHGDAIRWMTDKLGTPFVEAVKELAAQAGMEMPVVDRRQIKREQAAANGKTIMAEVAASYARNLLAGKSEKANEARKYLRAARGISPDIAREFQLGLSRPMSEVFTNGHVPSVDQQVELGLMWKEGARSGDFFRDRLMIPIHDTVGKVIGFGGRILGEGQPKYKNSPATPLFDKGRVLFNYHRAAPEVRAKNQLLIVEGYMDVIGLHSVGVLNAMAPNGTALTEAQIALAWRVCDKPTAIFDGDAAGRKAAIRAAYTALPLLVPGKGMAFAFPPEGEDPDDMARAGGIPAINELCDKAMSLADVVWQNITAGIDARDPDNRAKIIKASREAARLIKDKDVCASYSAYFTRKNNELFNRLDSGAAGAAQRQSSRPLPPRKSMDISEQIEAGLLFGILAHTDFVASRFEELIVLPWAHADTLRLVEALCIAAAEGGYSADVRDKIIERQDLRGHIQALREGTKLHFTYLKPSTPNPTAILAKSLQDHFKQ